MTVWKFYLPVDDRITIAMPRGARPLCVQVQANKLCLWVAVDPSADPVNHLFLICGTGHHRDDIDFSRHIGSSFQIHGGTLVFHVFDGGEQP